MLQKKLNVLIVDSRAMVRTGLSHILSRGGLVNRVDAVDTFPDEKQQQHQRPHDVEIVQFDLLRGNKTFGPLIAKRRELTNVLLLCAGGSEKYAVPLIAAGASGCLDEASAAGEILSAVQTVGSGQRYLNSSLSIGLADAMSGASTSINELSIQEMAVLSLISQGYRVADIAEKLRISDKTVNTYKLRIKRKTGMRSIVQMTRFAIESQLGEK